MTYQHLNAMKLKILEMLLPDFHIQNLELFFKYF